MDKTFVKTVYDPRYKRIPWISKYATEKDADAFIEFCLKYGIGIVSCNKVKGSKIMNKFTPGPWKNDYMPPTGFGCGYGKSQIIAADGRAIAAVAAVEPNEGKMYNKIGLSKATFETIEANAKLISAAPELLEACQHVLDNLTEESPKVWEHEIAHLQYAIDKAI